MNRFFTLFFAASCLTAVGQCPEIGQQENSCGQCYFPEGESGTFTATYTGEIGVWTVPPGVTEISITLSGAQGGQNIHGGCSNYFGGLGATLSADFEVSAGTELFYIVGEQGHEYNNQQSVHPSANGGGGGGGGSFVWTLSSGIKNLLIAAGGGGGSSACSPSISGGIIPDDQYYGIGGTGELSGTADVLGTISGGVNGSDGLSIHPEVYSGEGLGWNSISVNPLSIPEFNGAAFGYVSNEAAGAFGGGGTSSGDHNGGGGGGYSGGGARPYNGYVIYDENGNSIQYISGFPGELCGGGGGGSFNSGMNQEFLGTLQTGNGILQIEYDGALPICGGCTDPEACNFDLGATIDNGTCVFIPEGDCDCNGNQLDALWVCGGLCGADVDADGICDDIDDCVGIYDACGICNGAGANLECGCEGIPDGACDCDGNQLDVLGVCGGSCNSDVNGNGVCDDNEALGCTYPLADNFNEGATLDDGTCIFPCEGQVNVNVFDWDGDYVVTVTDFLMMLSVYGDTDVDLDGVWDSGDDCVDTNACNYANDPSEPCAYIDVLGVCGGGCEGDEDNDGICDDIDTCIGVEDECGVCNGPGPTEVVIEDITILYDSVYAENIDTWFVYEIGQDTTFSYTCAPLCGEPVSYQGYDYATVLIGDQCWFAENLRSENYENGDAIPSGLSHSEWGNATAGAVAVYGEVISDCFTDTPDGNACDEAWSLIEYGRLYNWYAVDDARGLCPSGWHVPSDEEWTVVTDVLGGESVAGGQMKTTYGWHDGINSINGTNSSGFSGLPGGFRFDGSFEEAGGAGSWWSSSTSECDFESCAWNRFMTYNYENVFPGTGQQHYGSSVRCVRDAE